MGALQVVTYILAAGFIVFFAARMYKYAKMPIHLRWELYPIVGETKRPWGGSYLEEPDWWEKPPEEKSFIAEMKFMGKEIIFFKEYFHRNRSLWYIVFPFHIGVFLFATFFVLLFIGALTMAGGIPVSEGSSNAWGLMIHYVTLIVGAAALITGAVACLALFIRKIVDPGMSTYTRRIEYFNILLVLAVFITGLLAWGVADPGFEIARGYMKSFITFNLIENLDSLVATHIILLALLLAYLPFTNIMHFFAKHFTYNAVRWEDAPNLRGSKLERNLAPLLQQRITWAAPHMQTISKWADIANEEIGESHAGRAARKGES